MEKGVGVSFGYSGAGSWCQELRESSETSPGVLQQGPGWVAQGSDIPTALSPRMLRGWGETSKGTGSRSHGLVPACRHLQRQQGRRHSP